MCIQPVASDEYTTHGTEMGSEIQYMHNAYETKTTPIDCYSFKQHWHLDYELGLYFLV